MAPIPLVLFGDGIEQPSGLSRILTDLYFQLLSSRPDLDVRTVGWVPWQGLPAEGVSSPMENGQHRWAFEDIRDWGAKALKTAYRTWFGSRRGIVLSVWDPSRLLQVLDSDLPVEWWGYFAIDGENVNGTISGPAAAVVQRYDRVLAYTEYGRGVLNKLEGVDAEALPHGIHLSQFTPKMTKAERDWATALFIQGSQLRPILGCVATNQARKDLGVYFQVLRQLKHIGCPMTGWLHTDRLISDAWSVPQLAHDCGIVEDQLVLTQQLSDRELAVGYASCAATFAPGRGEGWGYPIVESCACNTLPFHVDYAGGAEVTPPEGRIPPEAFHVESVYGIKRPILDPDRVANAIATHVAVLKAKHPWEGRGLVEPYDWAVCWPKWAKWIETGLQEGGWQ